MSSREHILSRAKANKPDLLELPIINSDVFYEGKDILNEFTKKLEVVGGNIINVMSRDIICNEVLSMFPDAKVNFSTLADSKEFNSISIESLKTPHELEDLDVLILESNLGVAENGAIWIEDNQIPMRVLPYITKHLVLVLKKENILPYMHQAYSKVSETDYGVFISGPSKTADIEQSLVIGAHGALSLTVFLLDESN